MKQKLSFITVLTLLLTTSFSFAYQATFTPRISISEEYTDNYNLTDKNKEDAFITRITPGFTAELPGRNIGADISYDFGYVMHDSYSEENYWYHSARFSGYSNLGRNTRLELTDSFRYTKDPLSQNNIADTRTTTPDVPIDSTIRRGREAHYSNITGLKLKHQFGRFGKASSIRMGYIYRFLNNEGETYEDNRGHTYSTGLTYWFLPRWGFDVNADYTRAEFDVSDDRDILSGNVGMLKKFNPKLQGHIRYSQTNVDYNGVTAEDDRTYNPSIGFDYTVPDDLSLFLDIGYFKNDFEFREDQSGLTGIGKLIKYFRRGYRRGSWKLSALAGYDYSIWGAENLNFEKFYEGAGSVTYMLTRLLNGTLYASYRHSDYPDVIPERTDKTTSVGIDLAIQPYPWISFGLNYDYRNVDSTMTLNEYNVNTIILWITLSTSKPYRSGHY